MVTGRFGPLGFDYRGTLVDGVIERLRRYMDRLYGGAVQKIGRFDDEISATNDLEQAWRTLLGQAPAILVSAGRARYENVANDRRVYKLDPLEIEVFFISHHMKDQASRLAGDGTSVDGGGDPGIERMMADAQALLWGFEIGKFSGLVLDEEDRGPQGEGALSFQQTWITDGLIEKVEIPELDTVHPPVAKVQASIKVLDQEEIEQ